jgi:hypothetical protein
MTRPGCLFLLLRVCGQPGLKQKAVAMDDLSSFAAGSLPFSGGGSSMAGGGTVSDVPWGGAAGSPSEQSSDLPYAPSHNSPEIDLGPAADLARTVDGGDALAAHSWTQAVHSGDNPGLFSELKDTWRPEDGGSVGFAEHPVPDAGGHGAE